MIIIWLIIQGKSPRTTLSDCGKNMIRKNLNILQFTEVDAGNSTKIFLRWRYNRFYQKHVSACLFQMALPVAARDLRKY